LDVHRDEHPSLEDGWCLNPHPGRLISPAKPSGERANSLGF